jgi:hypothetical protein
VLHRAPSFAAKLRKFQVLIDGTPIDRIANGESRCLTMAPGRHELRLKLDWCGSPPVIVDLGPREQAEFVCRTVYRSAVDPVLRPRRYIDLVPFGEPFTRQRTGAQDLAIRLPLCLIGVFTLIAMAIANVGVLVSVAVGTALILFTSFVPIPMRAGANRRPHPRRGNEDIESEP